MSSGERERERNRSTEKGDAISPLLSAVWTAAAALPECLAVEEKSRQKLPEGIAFSWKVFQKFNIPPRQWFSLSGSQSRNEHAGTDPVSAMKETQSGNLFHRHAKILLTE